MALGCIAKQKDLTHHRVCGIISIPCAIERHICVLAKIVKKHRRGQGSTPFRDQNRARVSVHKGL